MFVFLGMISVAMIPYPRNELLPFHYSRTLRRLAESSLIDEEAGEATERRHLAK